MDEPLGAKRAAELAESGHRTELLPSSIKFAPKGKRHERETGLGAPNELRALAEGSEGKR
jgi:NADH-quinone oxidoreductase subunit B